MTPLTNDEGGLLQAVSMFGSASYPVRKYSAGKWFVTSFRSWKGFPTAFKTKKAAVERFEMWHTMALERWAAMKAENPHLMLTQYEIRCMDSCSACKAKGY
jgi:hypothetical protein